MDGGPVMVYVGVVVVVVVVVGVVD